MLIFILMIIFIFTYILFLNKVNIIILFKINYIDKIQIKFIFKFKNTIIYTYKLYFRSGVNKYIESKKNKAKKKNPKSKKDRIINLLINDITRNKAYIKMSVGANSVILMSYLVVIITTLVSIICGKYLKRENIPNVKYDVLPNYKNTCIIFESMLKIKVITLILIILLLKKNKSGGYKNGRTSN